MYNPFVGNGDPIRAVLYLVAGLVAAGGLFAVTGVLAALGVPAQVAYLFVFGGAILGILAVAAVAVNV